MKKVSFDMGMFTPFGGRYGMWEIFILEEERSEAGLLRKGRLAE
jgi:hypothetical protein